MGCTIVKLLTCFNCLLARALYFHYQYARIFRGRVIVARKCLISHDYIARSNHVEERSGVWRSLTIIIIISTPVIVGLFDTLMEIRWGLMNVSAMDEMIEK